MFGYENYSSYQDHLEAVLNILYAYRLYTDEVEQSRRLNERLGIAIGAFQGLTNMTINALSLVVLYAGGSLLASSELSPGNLMSFLASTQLIQRCVN